MNEPQPVVITEKLISKPELIDTRVYDILTSCEKKTIPILPVSSFMIQAGLSDSKHAEIYKSFASHAQEIACMPAISVIDASKATPSEVSMLQEWRANDLKDISETLQKFGVRLSPEQLDSAPPIDEILKANPISELTEQTHDLTDLLYLYQLELNGLWAGTRVLEETKRLLELYFPKHVLPTKPTIAIYTYGSLRDKQNGGAGLFLDSNNQWQHVMAIIDSSHGTNNDNVGSLQGIVQSKIPVILGPFATRAIRASHEYGGHSAFCELYSIPILEQYQKITAGMEKSARLDLTMTEGYAIHIERIASSFIRDATPAKDKQYAEAELSGLTQSRTDYFAENQKHPEKRIYPDGDQMIANIIRDTGSKKLSSVAQLENIRAILRTTDVIALTQITPDNPLYQQCIEKPLQYLPRFK